MLKIILLIGCLSFAIALDAQAQDSNRIDQLEKELQETKLRVTKLESLLSNPSNAQKPATSGDGWNSIANWRKLAKEMSPTDVQKILGEPHRVDRGTFSIWHYRNDGRVNFYQGKVYQWTEPRQ